MSIQGRFHDTVKGFCFFMNYPEFVVSTKLYLGFTIFHLIYFLHSPRPYDTIFFVKSPLHLHIVIFFEDHIILIGVNCKRNPKELFKNYCLQM